MLYISPQLHRPSSLLRRLSSLVSAHRVLAVLQNRPCMTFCNLEWGSARSQGLLPDGPRRRLQRSCAPSRSLSRKEERCPTRRCPISIPAHEYEPLIQRLCIWRLLTQSSFKRCLRLTHSLMHAVFSASVPRPDVCSFDVHEFSAHGSLQVSVRLVCSACGSCSWIVSSCCGRASSHDR